jgi:hypothetical protein
MKKFFILFTVFAMPFCGFTQSRYFINLNGAWDYSMNKYHEYNTNNLSPFQHDGAEFSYGLDIGYKFSDIVRFRVEGRIGEYKYGGDWDSDSGFESSTMKISYFDIIPRFDFRVWQKNKLELFVSPGLKLEYISDANQKTIKADGTISREGYISSSYAENMAGIVGGAVLKYNINSKWGITMSPEYTLFFKKLYEKNDNSMMRFSTRLGVEYSF